MYGHHLEQIGRHPVRLPILPVVSRTGKIKCFPCPWSRLKSWSRETGSAVPSRVNPLISSPPLSGTASIHTVNRYRASPEFIGPRNFMPMAFTAESPPARPAILKVVPVMGAAYSGNPMDKSICPPFLHSHYW